jgi:hypothetical protein
MMPSRLLCNEGKETSRERWETDTTCPCDLTKQRNDPGLQKASVEKAVQSGKEIPYVVAVVHTPTNCVLMYAE